MSGSVLSENIATLEGRVDQLKKGHIAVSDVDETNCAIHWLEGMSHTHTHRYNDSTMCVCVCVDEGVWDFYMFDNQEENVW